MSKNFDNRLQETIDFIRTAPMGNFRFARTRLMSALKNWQRTAPLDSRRRLSELMSQADSPDRPGNATDRTYRRAMILVDCALVQKEIAWPGIAASMNQNTTNLGRAYERSLVGAIDWLYSDPSVAATSLDLLRSHTREFLRTFDVNVNGRPTNGSMQYGFKMSAGIYKFDCFTPQTAQVKVQAINVPAVNYQTVQQSLGQIKATTDAKDPTCDLILTTQFTGCCYCFEVNGGHMAAAHIAPNGLAGRVISQNLRASGGFRNSIGGTFTAFGRVPNGSGLPGYPKSATRVIIVGVKRRGSWRVYARISEGSAVTVRRLDKASAKDA